MPKKMLIVDDDKTILFALSDLFESSKGFTVDCAGELEEAERLLESGNYDVVIADLRLSGIQGTEGLELVSYVREKCPGTKVMLLTAYSSPQIYAEAQRRGVDAFLHKPKPLNEVAHEVSKILAN